MTPPRDTPHPARAAAVRIVTTLRDAGHVAYLAGGCVRDALMGLMPKDYDVATDALPERVRELFHNSKFVGEAFGVVLVRVLGHEIEVATFRVESGYDDGRRPSRVQFTDARSDAQRRDFTINGLFEDPLATDPRSAIIDYVGGQADINAKILRAIGDADARFAEDYLRMLRAVRFASRLHFAIDELTARAMRIHARYLGQISRERIGMETRTMLAAPSRGVAAQLLQDLRLDGPTLNEEHLDTPPTALAALPHDASYPVTLAAWMIDRHAPVATTPPAGNPAAPHHEVRDWLHKNSAAVLNRWRKALCLSNDDRDRVQAILRLMPAAIEWHPLRIAHRKRALASPAWAEVFTLLGALHARPGVAALYEQIHRESAPLIADGVEPKPWITGDDLIALGLAPGPGFKKLLDDVYDAQLEHRLANRDEAIAWAKAFSVQS